MLKTYIIIAWRNLVRNKLFSFINLAGLAIGLCCFLLISMYVTDEWSFDRYHEKADRTYRIQSDIRWGGQDIRMIRTSDVMGPVLKKDYPQVETYTRLYAHENRKLVKKNEEYILEEKTAYADSTFFDVFTLPAIQGDTRTALDQPHTVVITASTAQKYFGSTDVTGRYLDIKEDQKTVPYKITAVIKDIPSASHFHFDFLFSMKSLNYEWGQTGNYNFYTYIVLKPGIDYKTFQGNMRQFVINYLIPALAPLNIHSMAEFEQAGNFTDFYFMPLTRIHLYSDRQDELSPPGNIQYVYAFCAVALFILLIACINFMNLTTAHSAGRSKEVGIRKVLGTTRKELIGQFLTESTLMAILALLAAMVLTYCVLPLFNSIAGKTMALSYLMSSRILPWLLLLPFAVGILAGSYPAFFLSGFRPVEVLKGKLSLGGKSAGLRSVLVVFQFSTAVFLIIGTLVVYQQLRYIQNSNPGFNKDQVLVISGAAALGSHTQVFKKEMLSIPEVKNATVSSYLPVSGSDRNAWNICKEAVPTATNSFNTQKWEVDYDYLETMGMQLAAGSNFRHDYGADSSAVIINEVTAGILGYKDPIGKIIYCRRNDGTMDQYPIIGVVKNFHYESVHQKIGPLCLTLDSYRPSLVSLKVTGTAAEKVIAQARLQWKKIAPGMPFNYYFLDESFNRMYKADQQVQQLAMIFSALSVIIACMGIFGLATFMAAQRAHEIGIRKVLGSSVTSIIQLLNRDFIRLVAISFVIAAPPAWWAMNKWLNSFAYRVHISIWVFVVAGAATLFIALCTVSFQSVRAALANPLKSLKTN
ncbi:cell division protein FtsX [Chitinophaga flava]|uniref:Cell division protein FtsX n=2 Tax=Chitinophaga flava TaxID=2259036 RepID=A0A365XX80_9BACT|nr:cell division protein FtsX [Chitinophaga flava]